MENSTISRSPRPVFTKQQEQTDEEEGLLEKSIERQPMYYRQVMSAVKSFGVPNITYVAGGLFLFISTS